MDVLFMVALSDNTPSVLLPFVTGTGNEVADKSGDQNQAIDAHKQNSSQKNQVAVTE